MNADGSVTEETRFELAADNLRPVRDDVLEDMDGVLGRAGHVMHAIDPARLVTFESGGPPVWSVGMVQVQVPQPYQLFLTYGFSHVFSPEPSREGIHHELSIAISPHLGNTQVWAVALLRHLARYVLRTGNDLKVGDVMPCRAPITRIAFQPEHHAMMPDTALDSIVVAADPVIPRIDTRGGPIEVRRIVGITEAELHRLGPLPASQRGAARASVDSLLLTTP